MAPQPSNLNTIMGCVMSISEVLLFIATNSRECAGTMDFKERHKFPAQIVRLDSSETRSIAANGKYFQVTSVPSMVVIYDDGNTQMFVGTPKIIQWMTMIIKSTRSQGVEEKRVVPTPGRYFPAGGTRGPVNREESFPPEDRDREPRTVYIEEDEEVWEEEPAPKPKSKPKAKPKPKAKTKAPLKKKKPPVRFEEESEQEIEVEYIAPEAPSPTQKRQPSRMSGIYNAAKQMEHDRKASLGYKEEDLPRYQ